MRVLVLQHIEGGHPWFLGQLLRDRGGDWTPLRMDLGETPPPVESYDALWVMGGAMQVWQEEEHPWLPGEKRFVRDAVERGLPFLGICLGHQLLAEAMGGVVGPATIPEIGLFPVEVTADGQESHYFAGAHPGRALQWHTAEVKELPTQARCLARSEACGVQAMEVGPAAFSIQYHAEVAAGTLPAWCESDTARQALETRFGSEGPREFERRAAESMDNLNAHARLLFANWFANAEGQLA